MLLVGPAGCRSTVERGGGDSRPLPPAPRAGQSGPPGAHAKRIAMQVAAKPRDTNGNRYPDLIEVMANLFSDHPMPMYEDGTFVFQMYPSGRSDVPDARPIREWRIGGERLRAAQVGNTIYGLTYRFALSLLDEGGDQFPLMSADLICRFEPADGRAPIHRRDVHTMQIGSDAPGIR
ncbi:MAG: hypothetical protein ACR2GY_14305 [Phycisphaerales bacterium]